MPTLLPPSSSAAEIRTLKRDLKRYEELISAYSAIEIAKKEQSAGKLKTLSSLTKLMCA